MSESDAELRTRLRSEAEFCAWYGATWPKNKADISPSWRIACEAAETVRPNIGLAKLVSVLAALCVKDLDFDLRVQNEWDGAVENARSFMKAAGWWPPEKFIDLVRPGVAERPYHTVVDRFTLDVIRGTRPLTRTVNRGRPAR